MERILRSRLGANLLLIAASAALPAASVHFLMTEGNAPISGKGHLFIMAIGASVAAVASIALMARGLRIDLNLEFVGRTAGELLLRAIDGHASGGTHVIQPRLVIRESSGPAGRPAAER